MMQPLEIENYKVADTAEPVREVVIGNLESTAEAGTCRVSFWYREVHYVRTALVAAALPAVALQQPVALGFANADLDSPIVLGMIHANLQSLLHLQTRPETAPLSKPDAIPASRILEAADDIELRCGEASIRLTRAGRVLINGEYVLTCSRGVNRIVGASVEVN